MDEQNDSADMKKSKPKSDNGVPFSFETFRKLGAWDQGRLKQDTPNCINGIVEIHKYRVAVELIDEPNEVLVGRLKDLWERCDNFHHVGSLKAEAAALGVDPDKEWGWIGSKLKRKVET